MLRCRVRIVVVSDIHSNLGALGAVTRHAEAGGAVDAVWCTGDIVGYGAQPREVIAELRARDALAVAGNHDLAACGRLGVEDFNDIAADAAIWTAGQLTADDVAYLRDLPLTVMSGDVTLVHGSLRAPEWEYLLSPEQAIAHFALQTTPYSIVGHSHQQFWADEMAFHAAPDGGMLQLGERRIIINSGSVGQPRDSDPRAGYVLYDDSAATITWHRVEYDIAATQRVMRDAGVNDWLSDRLAIGR